jgi:chromosome segregation ATPase
LSAPPPPPQSSVTQVYPPPAAATPKSNDDRYLESSKDAPKTIPELFRLDEHEYTCRVPKCRKLPNGNWICGMPREEDCITGRDAFYIDGRKAYDKLISLQDDYKVKLLTAKHESGEAVTIATQRLSTQREQFGAAQTRLQQTIEELTSARNLNGRQIATLQSTIRTKESEVDEARRALEMATQSHDAAIRAAEADAAERIRQAQVEVDKLREEVSKHAGDRELISQLKASESALREEQGKSKEIHAAAISRASADLDSLRQDTIRLNQIAEELRGVSSAAASEAAAAVARQRAEAAEAVAAAERNLEDVRSNLVASTAKSETQKSMIKALRKSYNALKNEYIRHLNRLLQHINNQQMNKTILHNKPELLVAKAAEISAAIAKFNRLPDGKDITTESLYATGISTPITEIQQLLDRYQNEENTAYGRDPLPTVVVSENNNSDLAGGKRRTRKYKIGKRKHTKKRHLRLRK